MQFRTVHFDRMHYIIIHRKEKQRNRIRSEKTERIMNRTDREERLCLLRFEDISSVLRSHSPILGGISLSSFIRNYFHAD